MTSEPDDAPQWSQPHTLDSKDTMMRAVLLRGYGGLDMLDYRTDVPRPTPGPGEVVVKVRAAAVNNTDIATRTAWYNKAVGDADATQSTGRTPESIAFPRIQGAAAAGVLAELGEGVVGRARGEVVAVDPFIRDLSLPPLAQLTSLLGKGRDGGFAEYVVVPVENAVPVDPRCGLTFAELACLPAAYQTAEEMQIRAGVRRGDKVLVTGASGGVGLANVELAKMRGAVVAAVAHRTKHGVLRERGADYLLDREADLCAATSIIFGERETDIVLDVVGGPTLPAMITSLKRGGHYVTAGAIAGPFAELDLRDLIYGDLRMTGVAVARPEALENLIRYAEAGTIRPTIWASYPLARLAAAQAEFARKSYVGKIVIDIDRGHSPLSDGDDWPNAPVARSQAG